MIDAIANEIILASLELHTNNVSEIATGLGYQPILIINALVAGEKAGKFTYIKKKDLINISEGVEVDSLAVTDGLADSRDQVETFITNQNDMEKDIIFQELHGFIPMLPELHLKLAIRSSKFLSTYELSDPKDKQSVYTFITLAYNLDKKWGTKQFDASKPSKFALAGKKGK